MFVVEIINIVPTDDASPIGGTEIVMNIKKIVICALAATMVFTLTWVFASCGNGNSDPSEQNGADSTTEESFDNPGDGPVIDGEYYDTDSVLGEEIGGLE